MLAPWPLVLWISQVFVVTGSHCSLVQVFWRLQLVFQQEAVRDKSRLLPHKRMMLDFNTILLLSCICMCYGVDVQRAEALLREDCGEDCVQVMLLL